MNSRYMRPAPQQAQIPQLRGMQPLQWPTMNVPPPPQIAPTEGAGGGGLMGGLTQLGTAAVGRFGGEDEPEAPEVRMPAVATPVVPDPVAPTPVMPAYGAPPAESPMQKKKPSLIDMLMGGYTG